VSEPEVSGSSATLADVNQGDPSAPGVEVATFTHANGVEDPGHFSATVDWNDGNGPVAADPVTQDGNGTYHVTATRPVYVDEGSATVTVVTSDNDSPAVTMPEVVPLVVNEPGVSGRSATLAAVAEGDAAASGVEIATFTHANGVEGPGHFSATVDWNDG